MFCSAVWNEGEYAAWMAYTTTYAASSRSSHLAGPAAGAEAAGGGEAGGGEASGGEAGGGEAGDRGAAGPGRSESKMNSTDPAATTKYSGTSRLAVVPPDWIGIRNGSARRTAPASSAGRRPSTNAAARTANSAAAAPSAANSG